MDLVNFLNIKSWEILFNFDDFGYTNILLGNLHIQFQRLFGNINHFDVFEVFRDLINLLLQFGRDWDGIFSILARVDLLIDLLFLLDRTGTLGVNFTEIFCLSEFKFLLAISEFYLDR